MKTKMNILIEHEYSIHSQNGEDGIIQYIFDKIGTTNKVCVEIGVSADGNGTENNTLNLLSKNWYAYWFDFEKISHTPDNCCFIESKVTKDNIVKLFESNNIATDIDLLSIDIDSNDYHIREVLSVYNPRVYIMEYNGCYDYDTEYVMPRNDNFIWKGQRNFGASLLSLTNQANRLGYDLVYCDSKGINAFFIRKDVNVFSCPTPKQAYILPKVEWIKQEELLKRHKIINLYRQMLKRMPDEEGLLHYSHSKCSVEEIENILKNSTEAKRIHET
jgi:hypothetical protein